MKTEPDMSKQHAAEAFDVEVVYALPDRQCLETVRVIPGTTAEQAVQQSGLPRQFPDVDFAALKKGIFSRLLDGRVMPSPQDYVVQPGDRVEVYRPLKIDPKQARLLRAARSKSLR